MGLTFKKSDELEKMLDKFAIMPDDPKDKAKKKPNKDQKDNEQKKN